MFSNSQSYRDSTSVACQGLWAGPGVAVQGQREKFCGLIQLLWVLMVVLGQCVRIKFIEMNTKKTVTRPYDKFSSEIEKGNEVYTLFLVLPNSYQTYSDFLSPPCAGGLGVSLKGGSSLF